MTIFDDLGVHPVINATGPSTRLGGSRLPPEVLCAMHEAAGEFVRIDELQAAAGKVIAEITGAQAGYVTSGASAGMALATAACMTGTDPIKINRLPDVTGMRHEVIIQRAQKYDYDHAIRSVGAQLVEVGFPDLTFAYEVEAAITERTAAVAYFPTVSRPALPLDQIVNLAHKHDVPVIVDAAMELPPPESLSSFVDSGADLIAFSGGKALEGPQASGVLCGRADLIRAVAFNHQDMDVREPTWTYAAEVNAGELIGPPHHGIGRAMKVGKEEIAGLIAALRRYVTLDHAALAAGWRGAAEAVARGLCGIDGVAVAVVHAPSTGMHVTHARIILDEVALGITAYGILEKLGTGEPRIYLNEDEAAAGVLIVNPMTLSSRETDLVVARLQALLLPGESGRERQTLVTAQLPEA